MNEQSMAQRVDSILAKAQHRDQNMSKTQSQREWQLMIKREQELIRREEKWLNVERISKATEYKKAQMLEKIEYDNEKTASVRAEKDKLLKSRAAIRREAERQKQAILETFEKMRKRGKVDKGALAQFGINLGGHAAAETIEEEDTAELGGEDTRNQEIGYNNHHRGVAHNENPLETQINPNDSIHHH